MGGRGSKPVSKEIEEGAGHLKKLAANINTDKFSAPSFLMLLTGGEFAYRRDEEYSLFR